VLSGIPLRPAKAIPGNDRSPVVALNRAVAFQTLLEKIPHERASGVNYPVT
jgi:hypothetical protein